MIHTKYPHMGRYAGFTQLAPAMDPARFRVHLRGSSDSDADLPLPHPGLRHWARARLQASGMAWYKLSDLAGELRALPGCLLNRTAIVHFLDGEHSGQYLPRWIERSRVSRVRTVATFHQPVELLDSLVSRSLVARFDAVTLVAPTQVPWFHSFLPPERVHVILHGVDCDFFHPSPSAPADAVFRCITVGHWLRDYAALKQVAEHFAATKAVAFDIVTSRDTGLEGLPNVTFHRSVDDSTLRQLYQQADALLLPLSGSTANNALLEGIASGLPVISTRLPAVQAYLPGEEALLVPANDGDALAGAVESLLEDPALRIRMGAAARRRAEALDWAIMAREYEALYSELLRQ